MGAEQAKLSRRERIFALAVERDVVSDRLDALNREMMRLSPSKRRERWAEYYRRLCSLVQRHRELEQAMEALRHDIQ